jgi:hypothetical protein
MGHRSWGLLAVVSVVAACGGRASSSNGAAGSPATAPEPSVAGSPATAPELSVAGSPATAPEPSAGAAGAAGTDSECRGSLDDLKAVDVECAPELCAETVSAVACDALPAGVVRTREAGCDGNGMADATGDGRLRTLTFELSATRRKACYYEAYFEAPARLVGAQIWEDKASFCDSTSSQISAGVVPPTKCSNAWSLTLCDLVDPTQSAPPSPSAPACYSNGSATCGPCCDTTPPDCTGKPESYGGCAPVGNAYCSCGCHQQQWSCEC